MKIEKWIIRAPDRAVCTDAPVAARGDAGSMHAPRQINKAGLLATAVAGLIVYRLTLRPRLLGWGAGASELGAPLPGDEIIANPHVVSTRAVTIDAPRSSVWPWLVQMGYRRGGLYSYDRLDRLFGYLDAPSADSVLPQFQQISAGDVIPLGRGPSWRVALAEPDCTLVLEPVPGAVSWSFVLHGQGGTTRLISRVRVGVGSGPVLWAAAPLVELPWFLMERRMLFGIERRAEQPAVRLEAQPERPRKPRP